MTWDEQTAAHRTVVHWHYAVLRRSPRHDMRWVTVIHAAWVVRLGDSTADLARDVAAGLATEWRQTLMDGGRIRRAPRGYTRAVGTIELDLLHPAVVCSDMKKALLSEFGIDSNGMSKYDRVLVLHTHMLIDGRGHSSWSALERDLRAQWPEPRRVHVAQLYITGTVAENLERMADYSTKFKFVYSKALIGKTGEFTGLKYEHQWREYVENVYLNIGFDNLKVSTVKPRRKSSKLYSYARESAAEPAKIEEPQLISTNDIIEYKSNTNISANTIEVLDVQMRISQILPYVNTEKRSGNTFSELCDALKRMSGNVSKVDQLHVQYGDEAGDIEIEQARMDLQQTRAEVARLHAETVKQLADVYDGG